MFRFTIRDVLWLTALVAMGAAWWIDRGRMKAENLKVWQAALDSNAAVGQTLNNKNDELMLLMSAIQKAGLRVKGVYDSNSVPISLTLEPLIPSTRFEHDPMPAKDSN